jgi:hypothetical protein
MRQSKTGVLHADGDTSFASYCSEPGRKHSKFYLYY